MLSINKKTMRLGVTSIASEVPNIVLIQVLGVIFLVILSGSLTRSRLTRSHVLLELVLTFSADNYRRWVKT